MGYFAFTYAYSSCQGAIYKRHTKHSGIFHTPHYVHLCLLFPNHFNTAAVSSLAVRTGIYILYSQYWLKIVLFLTETLNRPKCWNHVFWHECKYLQKSNISSLWHCKMNLTYDFIAVRLSIALKNLKQIVAIVLELCIRDLSLLFDVVTSDRSSHSKGYSTGVGSGISCWSREAFAGFCWLF